MRESIKEQIVTGSEENESLSGLVRHERAKKTLDDRASGSGGVSASVEVEAKGNNGVAAMIESPFIVTIDGPAASGKSSVSRELARRFGWSWVSTGAFYRGLAFVAHDAGIDIKDESAVVHLARTANWKIHLTSEETLVILNGRDVTADIAREDIGTLASQISQFPKVRTALLDAQRQCAKETDGLVAEGRDCGTVVFPQAQVKIFLTARAEDRAARRALEEGRDLTKTIDDQKRRDAQDANRKAAPMQAPVGSDTIDTTDLSLPQVVDEVEKLVRQKIS
jgi:cytidylate kinase